MSSAHVVGALENVLEGQSSVNTGLNEGKRLVGKSRRQP